MNKYIFSLLGLVICQLALGQFDPEAKDKLDAMSARYKQLGAFTAEFTQKLSNESAEIEESVDGKVTVQDSKYRLEIAGQMVFNDGENLWTYNEEINEVTVAEFVPDDQEISLNNIWDLYKDGYKYILLSTNPNGSSVIDLDPVDRSKTFFKVRMILSKNNELLSFTIFENNGNKYQYAINEFAERNDLPPNFFQFDPADYPGVEVIDFR